MTAEEYRNYLEQDFSDVDINEMTDLRMIKADRNKSLQERRDIFLNKVGKSIFGPDRQYESKSQICQ